MRKKDKKTPTTQHPPSKDPSVSRSDSRGGGRGGRGGRGGAVRGGRGRGGGRPPVNGHAHVKPATSAPEDKSAQVEDLTEPAPDKSESNDVHEANGPTTAPVTWSSEPTPAEPALTQSQPSTSAPWGANSGWNAVAAQSKPPISSAKLPATSKLSWAQIAKCVMAATQFYL